MPSQQLTLLRARVRYLDGKVGAVQRDFEQIAAEERDLTQRTGARPSIAGQAAISLLPAGYPIAVARSAVGDWPSFDRRWAATTGPKVRDMMSALARFEQLGRQTPAGRVYRLTDYPEAERQEAQQLWDQGNRLARIAADMHHRWIEHPVSMRDSLNRGWGSRWFELLVARNSPIVALAGAASGGTVSEMAESAASRVSAAGGSLARAGSASAAETLTRPSPAEPQTQEAPGYGLGWSKIVTGGLVIAGVVVAWKIGKDIFAPAEPAKAEEE